MEIQRQALFVTFLIFNCFIGLLLLQINTRFSNFDNVEKQPEPKNNILVKRSETYETKVEPLESIQTQRIQRIKEVCQKYATSSTYGIEQEKIYSARFPGITQTLSKDPFVTFDNPPIIFCYNNKVASSTWLVNIGKLLPHENLQNQDEVRKRMKPKDVKTLIKAIQSGKYYKFLVVRHPLERLVSAYLDRILNACSWQAHYFVPKIFQYSKSKKSNFIDAKSGCINVFPTFQEFLRYVIHFPFLHDPHWMSYSKHCSTCLVPYDAVIKMETSKLEEQFVLAQSGLNKYIQLDYEHYKAHGNIKDKMKNFISNITCQELNDVAEVYKMDFEMFDYSIDVYKNYCITK